MRVQLVSVALDLEHEASGEHITCMNISHMRHCKEIRYRDLGVIPVRNLVVYLRACDVIGAKKELAMSKSLWVGSGSFIAVAPLGMYKHRPDFLIRTTKLSGLVGDEDHFLSNFSLT